MNSFSDSRSLDGTICKNDKSTLLKLLENCIDNEPPQHTDVLIFDGFFALYQINEIRATFGNISKKILEMFVTK